MEFLGGVYPITYSIDATKNIGTIARTTTTIPTTSFVQTFKYDAINRLKKAKEKTGAATKWQQTFGYDIFGNRTSFAQTVNSVQLPINNLTLPNIGPTKNQFTTGRNTSMTTTIILFKMLRAVRLFLTATTRDGSKKREQRGRLAILLRRERCEGQKGRAFDGLDDSYLRYGRRLSAKL